MESILAHKDGLHMSPGALGAKFRAEGEGNCPNQAGHYGMATFFPHPRNLASHYTTDICLGSQFLKLFLFCHLIIGVYMTIHLKSFVWFG